MALGTPTIDEESAVLNGATKTRGARTNDMEELDALFREVLELGPNSDVRGLEQASEERWDSLAHMTLIMAMESQFGIRFELEDAVEIRSYRDALRLIERLRLEMETG